MWYAAAAGWLALCGLAFLAYKRPNLDKVIETTKIALAFFLAAVIMISICGIALFLFVGLPSWIFGPTGGLFGMVIGFWLFMTAVLADDGDSWVHGLKLSTAVMIVAVPALILIGKAG